MTAVQSAPLPGRSYRALPKHQVSAGKELYRAHSVSRDAWWFDNSPYGRFNLSDPRGTCYAATKAETAVREKVRDEVSTSGVVSRAFASSFTVSLISAPVHYKCASVSAAHAVDFGIVRELVTMDDYSIPQQWAEALEANTFEGIYYASAYTTGGPTALALFGNKGAPGPRFMAAQHMAGPDACEAAGMVVAGPPALKSLTII